VRLIVGLDGRLDDELLAELEQTSGARLSLVGVVKPGALYVLSLGMDAPSTDPTEASGVQSECAAAAERLRHDPRVRSVDVDARRQPQRP
jgi:hypothetical protein